MWDDGEVPLEDMIAIEQVAKELWQQVTNGTDQGWQALSPLAKRRGATARGWRLPSGATQSGSHRRLSGVGRRICKRIVSFVALRA